MSNAFPGLRVLSRRIIESLSQGESVLFSVPRYSLGRHIVDKGVELYAQANKVRVVPLTLVIDKVAGRIDYGEMWNSIATHLEKPPTPNALDAYGFEANWKMHLRRAKTPTVVLLNRSRPGLDPELYSLLQLLHQLMRYQKWKNGTPFLFVALDDFSLWFHERYASEIDSELEWMKRESVVALSSSDIYRLIMNEAELDEPSAKDIAVQICEITGGHIGLVAEIWQDLRDTSWTVQNSYWSERARMVLANSYVLEGIRRDIKEDPVGICTTALEFTSPQYTNEYESPRFQLLRKLGIIHGYSETEFRLCGGAIKTLVVAMSRGNPRKKVGTVETVEGETSFEKGPLVVKNSDIVIVQLSDIHVGLDHEHRLAAPGRIFNQGKASLAELLAQDLAAQGLVGRVDGVVISGDITCVGSDDEFRRAKEIVEDVLGATGLSTDQLVIIAGNHDVQWKEPVYAGSGFGIAEKHIDREPFESFLELLGKKEQTHFALTIFTSPDGKNALKIIGMDSNFVEGPNAAGVGYVSRETLSGASELLATDGGEGWKQVFRWAVVHHHVLPVASLPLEDARRKNVSVMGNASEILSWCKKVGIEVMLHGHEHQPGITVARRWMADASDVSFWPIAVIGAGSCGAKRELLGPISHNHYYILIRREADLLVRSRVTGQEGLGFVAHRDVSIGGITPKLDFGHFLTGPAK